MSRKDEEKRVELVTILAATFGREADVLMFQAYDLALGDIPVSALERGVKRALTECDFMPSPHRLRTMSGEMTVEQRAVVAFDEMVAAIKSVGYYGSVDFVDPTINAVVRSLGGWSHVCDYTSEQLKDQWTRKEFERLYKALSSVRLLQSQTAPLLSDSDRRNAAMGHHAHVNEPVRITLRGDVCVPGRQQDLPEVPSGEVRQRVLSVHSRRSRKKACALPHLHDGGE